MLQGMTVEYLFHRVWPLEAGDVLFHAAAGGVGRFWRANGRNREGIELIGSAGTDDKCRLALDNGAAPLHQLPQE